ncbi:hypothetical protein F442_02148, partial [Phytophthora nicotianae P10297]
SRKPSGLSDDHAYVKPGVSGRLKSLRRGFDYFVEFCFGTGTEELTNYARQAGLQPIATAELPTTPSRPQNAVPDATELAVRVQTIPDAVPPAQAAPAPPRRARTAPDTVPPVAQAAPVPSLRERDTPDGVASGGQATADQSSRVHVVPEATELPARARAIQDGTEWMEEPDGDLDTLDAFDNDSFLDAMRREMLFGRTAADDVNLCGPGSVVEQGSDDEDDGALMSSDDGEESGYDSSEASSGEDEVEPTFETTEEELRELTASGWTTYDADHCGELQLSAAADYYDGPSGPTRSALAFADSPLGLFFYFLPKKLWIRIAEESNRYRSQLIPELAQRRREALLSQQLQDPRKSVPPLAEIEADLRRFKPIKPHEIVHVVGLLMARAIAPVRDGLAKHRATAEDSAVPRGTFSRYMKRARFEAITRFLHFNDNEMAEAAHDKAWKIRPVLQAVEKTFRRGYRLGRCISFDEGMVPNRSRFNPIKVYMKDKPSKWGTKFYLTCCAETAYCASVEVYCGKKREGKKEQNVGPKSVVRNITKVLRGQPYKQLVITDNYYSSIQPSIKLHNMGLYHVGTVRKARLGWCSDIEYSQKKKDQKKCQGYPYLVALAWMDSKPVNMIATGCSTHQTTVNRREKDGSITVTPCPQLVVDYADGMSGVDVHDQLRLERYSLQKCVAFKKYYKQLFLGIVDMALVNGLIVHNIAKRQNDERSTPHASYLRRLHKDLLALRDIHFDSHPVAEDLVSGPVTRGDHALANTSNRYESDTQSKRRQYLCKVCSAHTSGKSFETSYFCPTCSDYFGGRVPLCPKVRRLEEGNTLSCAQIWHDVWNDGRNIPALPHQIRFRGKKRKRSETNNAESKENEGGEENEESKEN